jgi:anti-sigma regulatory factor (Ser/Thr protein kinase)
MSLTLALSERVQNVLTHANLIEINFYFNSVTVSNI